MHLVVDGYSSAQHGINAGVPQGPVLSATVCLLHTNDLLQMPSASLGLQTTAQWCIILCQTPVSTVKKETKGDGRTAKPEPESGFR